MILFLDESGEKVRPDFTGVIHAYYDGKHIASCEQKTEEAEEFSSDPCNPTSWNITSSNFTRDRVLTISMLVASAWTNYWSLDTLIKGN